MRAFVKKQRTYFICELSLLVICILMAKFGGGEAYALGGAIGFIIGTLANMKMNWKD
jgi:hypothetical protein